MLMSRGATASTPGDINMSTQVSDHNATQPYDANGLRGGTQGGKTPVLVPGSQPGGSNAIQANGASHIDNGPPDTETGGGTRNDVRQDAEDLFEGSRHISPSAAKQFARDDVGDVPTQAQAPHGAGQPRYHQIHADPKKAPGSQGDNEAHAPATRGESTGDPH
jgi:hypothetical protein